MESEEKIEHLIATVDKGIHELEGMCLKRINHFEYSSLAKDPHKVQAFVEIMNYRMLDFAESARELLMANHVIPALSTIRATVENVAIVYDLNVRIQDYLNNEIDSNTFDNRLQSVLCGTRYGEIKATNILSYINHLNKKYDGVRKMYDDVCEFVHPNADGLMGSYSVLDIDDHSTYLGRFIEINNVISPAFIYLLQFTIFSYCGFVREIRNKLSVLANKCEEDISKSQCKK